jgi:hypothetical protein
MCLFQMPGRFGRRFQATRRNDGGPHLTRIEHRWGPGFEPATSGAAVEPRPPGAKTLQLNHSASDSERPVGEWNVCDVDCRGSTIEVAVNDVQ